MSGERALLYEQGQSVFCDVHSLVAFAVRSQGLRAIGGHYEFPNTLTALYVMETQLAKLTALSKTGANVVLVLFESMRQSALTSEPGVLLLLELALLHFRDVLPLQCIPASREEEFEFLRGLQGSPGVFGLWIDWDAYRQSALARAACIARRIAQLRLPCLVPGSLRDTASEGGGEQFGIFYNFPSAVEAEGEEEEQVEGVEHTATEELHYFKSEGNRVDVVRSALGSACARLLARQSVSETDLDFLRLVVLSKAISARLVLTQRCVDCGCSSHRSATCTWGTHAHLLDGLLTGLRDALRQAASELKFQEEWVIVDADVLDVRLLHCMLRHLAFTEPRSWQEVLDALQVPESVNLECQEFWRFVTEQYALIPGDPSSFLVDLSWCEGEIDQVTQEEKEEHGLIRLDSKLIDALVDPWLQELRNASCLAKDTSLSSSSSSSSSSFGDYQSLVFREADAKRGLSTLGLNSYQQRRRAQNMNRAKQKLASYMLKYSESLSQTGKFAGKTNLRYVDVKSRSLFASSSSSDASSTEPTKTQGGKKGGGKKVKNDIRQRVALELEQKKIQAKIDDRQQFVDFIGHQNMANAEKIKRIEGEIVSDLYFETASVGLFAMIVHHLAELKACCEDNESAVGLVRAKLAQEQEQGSSPTTEATADKEDEEEEHNDKKNTHVDVKRYLDTVEGLVSCCFDAFRRFREFLEPKYIVYLRDVLALVGFTVKGEGWDSATDITPELSSSTTSTKKKKKKAGPTTKRNAMEVVLEMVDIEDGFGRLKSILMYFDGRVRQAVGLDGSLSVFTFQLRFLGKHMVRRAKTLVDSRVSYMPDAWQVEMLNCVDRCENCLIVAPTSSGKTFVAFYAMQVLLERNRLHARSEDKKILVFVAPTRALVNQVAAEIDARFGAVWGQFTEEYAVNVDRCQILVTVPQVLRLLLLDAARERWKARIFYIVFDEVHMIASKDESGPGYEHSLLLSPAPFLALSATVGGVQSCYSWMQSIQPDRKPVVIEVGATETKETESSSASTTALSTKAKKNKKKPKVNHSAQKQSEIENKRKEQERLDFIANAPSCRLILHKERFCDLSHFLFDAQQRGFTRVNRCSLFDRQLCPQSSVKVFAQVKLTAQESLELYGAMLAVASNALVDISEIARKRLSELHPDVFFANRAPNGLVYRHHTEEYQSALRTEVANYSSEHRQCVFRHLSAPVRACLQQYAVNNNNKDAFEVLTGVLAEQDMLPALMFCMHAHECEAYALQELKRLEHLEHAKKSQPDHLLRVRRLDNEMDAITKKIKELEASKGGKTRTLKEIETQIQKLEDQRNNCQSALVFLEGIDPEFSYLREGEAMDQTSLSYWLQRLEKHGITQNAPLIRCLLRGFGIHHEGLPRAYKLLVETMFRSAQLKFVIATKTLGLGVNMPCRTVVFLKDSPELTAVHFQQMSGRAGRRGFDTSGSVVFFDFNVNPEKMYRLMNCDLDPLQGVFSLSMTHVLQLVVMLARAEDKEAAVHAARQFLTVPFAAHSLRRDKTRFLNRLKHYAVAALNYLYERRLLTARGQPSALAAAATHVGRDPLNLKALALLESGLLTRVANQTEGVSDVTREEEVMRILAGSFFTRRVHVASDAKKLPTIVLDVAGDVSDVMHALDATTNRWLMASASALGHTEDKDDFLNTLDELQCTLPLSKVAFLGTFEAGDADRKRYEPEWLTNATRKVVTRSPFAALTGRGDSFAHCDEFERCSNGASQICIDALPLFTRYDAFDCPVLFNSYAYEFFKHGQFKLITEQHELGTSSEAWRLLDQWNKLLKTLCVLCMRLCVRATGDVVADRGMDGGVSSKTRVTMHDDAEEQEGEEDYVPESWDAELEEEQEEGETEGGKEWWEGSSEEEEEEGEEDEEPDRKVTFATASSSSSSSSNRRMMAHPEISGLTAILQAVCARFDANMKAIKVEAKDSVY